jgi:hypothetical protein
LRGQLGGNMGIDYLYEREKKMDRDDAILEWFESKIRDTLLEYCLLRGLEGNSIHKSDAKEFIVRALKNV